MPRIMLILPLLVAVLAPPGTTLRAQSHMVANGSLEVRASSPAEDIVSYGSTLLINGNVFGTVYAVNSEVSLGGGAVITGDMTFLKGALSIARNAVIRGRLLVYETLIRTDLPYVVQGDTLVFKDAGFKVQSLPGPVDPRIIGYMAKYLVMARPVPSGAAPVFPDFVRRSSLAEGIGSFRVSSLVEFNIQESIIDRSSGFKGTADGWNVEITAVRFDTPADSDYFWNKVRTIPEARINHSLHISLAGGAHWFFRHRDSSVVLWYRDNWLFCVEVSGRGTAEDRDALRDRIVEFYTRTYTRSSP